MRTLFVRVRLERRCLPFLAGPTWQADSVDILYLMQSHKDRQFKYIRCRILLYNTVQYHAFPAAQDSTIAAVSAPAPVRLCDSSVRRRYSTHGAGVQGCLQAADEAPGGDADCDKFSQTSGREATRAGMQQTWIREVFRRWHGS